MSWRRVSNKKKLLFIAEWLKEECDFTSLCRQYGILVVKEGIN